MCNQSYDSNNDWHENANLVFGFQCIDCDAAIGYEDVSLIDENDHLEFSVVCTEAAQNSGWSKIEAFKFRCPKCTKKK